jgi:uncharacterized lipoprotein YmbA
MRHAALVLALVLASACTLTRRTPELRYYTLSVPGAPAVDGLRFRVDAVTMDAPYATARMAYRTSPYRLDYYVYHRWAADPRQVVAAALRDYLEHGGADGDRPPLELSAHVRRFEEVDAPSGWSAALAADVVVRDGARVVLERTYEDTEPAESRNPEAVAAALSRALGRIVDRAVADVRATTAR